MQERELACRIVHFFPDEVVWRCRSDVDCECGVKPEEVDWAFSPFSTLRNANLSNPTTDPVFEFGGLWTDVVAEYFPLAITDDADKLPALSGIAQHVQTHNNPGQYIAGLWERDIVSQLSWHKIPGPDFSRGNSNVPSFSWAGWKATRKDALWWPEVSRFNLSMSAFVSADVRLATSNPFGNVSSCCLTLNGPLMSGSNLATMIEESARKVHQMPCDVHMDVIRSSSDETDHTSRLSRLISDLSTAVCLALWGEDSSDGPVAVGLLLRPVPKTTDYIRIGSVEEMPARWFDEFASIQTVTLV
jgi:hypothetical protein